MLRRKKYVCASISFCRFSLIYLQRFHYYSKLLFQGVALVYAFWVIDGFFQVHVSKTVYFIIHKYLLIIFLYTLALYSPHIQKRKLFITTFPSRPISLSVQVEFGGPLWDSSFYLFLYLVPYFVNYWSVCISKTVWKFQLQTKIYVWRFWT